MGALRAPTFPLTPQSEATTVKDCIPPAQLTHHARRRMSQRGLPLEAIHAALDWGHTAYGPSALFFTLDRRAIAEARRQGVDVSRWHGVRVVTSDSRVLTIYRDRSCKRVRR